VTEEEWFDRGDTKLSEWVTQNSELLSFSEMSAFEYAWELAGREMGIVK
jgi:hypothetical protein